MILIRIDGEEEEAKIQKKKKGVIRGRCILSLMPFILYIEKAIEEPRAEVHGRVRTVGETVITLRFAYDKEFCAENEVRHYTLPINRILKSIYEMQLNNKKTKVMACSKTNPNQLNISIDNGVNKTITTVHILRKQCN